MAYLWHTAYCKAFLTFLFLLLNLYKVIKIESWLKSFILKGLQNPLLHRAKLKQYQQM